MRDSIRGASPRSANSSRYTRLGITSATYWSPATTFSPSRSPRPCDQRGLGTGAGDDRSDQPFEKAGFLHDRGEAERAEDQPHRRSMLSMPPPENRSSIVALPLADSKPVAIDR